MKKNDNNFKYFLFLVIAFVAGGIITVSLLKWTPILNNTNTVITKNGTQVYEKSSLAAAVDKIYDAVVVVQGYNNDSLASTGTGFVYKTDDKYGYILTSQYVIEDMQKLVITMSNESQTDATVLGSDEYLDLAVLRIEKSYVTLIAQIGSSEDMKLGDTVFTVGNPMGIEYRGSVTSGVLSGKDRMVSVSVSSSGNDWIMRVLQIDASINPGNSGGPLLNVNGEVIGICSMKLVNSDIEGMGFAIPIEYAMSHAESLENGKKIEWPVLGISMVNVTDTMNLYRNGLNIDKNIKSGIVIADVSSGSGAANAGLKKGDIITKIDDITVKDHAYLRYELYQHQAGDKIKLTIIRAGKEKTVEVTLGK